MTTPKWQPGQLHAPGALVLPRTAPTAGAMQSIPNASFETGDLTDWTVLDGNFVVTDAEQGAYHGQYELTTRNEPENAIVSDFQVDVRPGDRVTVACYIKPTRGSDRGTVRAYWYDELGNPLPQAFTEIPHGQPGHIEGTGGWRLSSLTTTVPAGARKMAVGAWCRKYTGSYFGIDLFSWSYPVIQPQQGLMYKAVQPEAGYSDTTEPAWPGVLGQQVIDNEVTWEAVSLSRVVWEARPILKSGDTEPDWPESDGDMVADGTISWEAVSRRVRDPNCPQTKVVAIVASKVYAADEDIVRYSATVNPMDWSSREDAGFLPTGLQQYGANPVAALGIYRSNLVVFNAQAFQMWQVDENPANSALLDALPIGSTFHKALSPVSNDLFFLSSQGVRTVGIAGGSTNLAAGDVGMPIDPLIQAAIEGPAEGRATYIPSMGQYWLAFNDTSPVDPDDPDPLWIEGDLPDGRVGDPVDYTYDYGGGQGRLRFRIVEGSLPPGTLLDPETARVTGAFTQAGFFWWTVEVQDRLGNTASVNDTAQVLSASARSYTTPPYPIYVADAVGLSSQQVGGKFVPVPKPVDALLFGSTALGGSLRAVLQIHDAGHDAVAFGSTAIGGEMRSIRLHHNADPDAVHFQSTALGGELNRIMLRHTADPDAVFFQSTAIGGAFE